MRYRSGQSKGVLRWMWPFAVVDSPGGKLPCESILHAECQPRRKRVRFAAIDIPSVLVRFSSMKCGCFQLQRPMHKAKCDHAVGDVCRILLVVSQNRQWIL